MLSYWKLISFILLVMFGAVLTAEESGNVIAGSSGTRLRVESFGVFDEPWAMTFLPDKRLLVTEKSGRLLLVDLEDRSKTEVSGLPGVAYGGQGGLGDVILDPEYEKNRLLYLSYAENDNAGKRGAAVLRAELSLSGSSASLKGLSVIWRQIPKVSGAGHYSHRLAFSPDGKLFITSGDRQLLTPAQSWNQNLGKVIRLNPDGTVPLNNPFQDRGELARTFWSLGHRNLLGIAFDSIGRLWTHEMGPRDGDELNLTLPGKNYGWPLVSWGDHYSGDPIPDHDTRPDFLAPEYYWVPTIAPSGLVIYSGKLFHDWSGDALIGGLRSMSLIRVRIREEQVYEAERFGMQKRIREVEEGPDGSVWILEDRRNARLLRLLPE